MFDPIEELGRQLHIQDLFQILLKAQIPNCDMERIDHLIKEYPNELNHIIRIHDALIDYRS